MKQDNKNIEEEHKGCMNPIECAELIRKAVKKAKQQAIEEFCKEKTVISNFECSEHGEQKPIPQCPKCEIKSESDIRKQEQERIVEELKKERFKVGCDNCVDHLCAECHIKFRKNEGIDKAINKIKNNED